MLNTKLLARVNKTPTCNLMNASANTNSYPLNSNTYINLDKLDIPTEMTHLKNRSQSQTFSQTHTGRRNWLKIQNVIKGISLMRHNIVKTLKDPDEIV